MGERMGTKSRRLVEVFFLLLLVVVAGPAWAATGEVNITSPVPDTDGTFYASSNFTIQGTYIMTEDDTPVSGVDTWEACKQIYPYMGGKAWISPDCWNTTSWLGTHATLSYEIDGEKKGDLGKVEYWTGPNRGDDLGHIKTFSTVVGIAGLEPKPYHTIRVFLDDRFAVYCYYSAYNAESSFCPSGGEFASATLNFVTPTDIPPLAKEKNLGETCGLGTAHPINLATGNKYFREDDFSLNAVGGNLSFTRAYNSQSTYDGPLGYGWTHTYNLVLEVLDQTTLRIMKRDGRYAYFAKVGESLYRGTGNEYSRVLRSADGYVLHEADGGEYAFDTTGRLIRIEDKNGNVTVLTYDAGALATVQDSVSGRTLSFTYADGKLSSIRGPATDGNASGVLASFTYANGNLTGVVYSDGESFLYFYEDPGDPHNLTRKTKADGATVLNEVAYDSQDRAIRSSLSGGDESATVTYGHWQATVADSLGRTKVYKYDVIDGIGVPLEVEGDGCSGCAHKYEYGSATATDTHELTDGFSGSDGSTPDPSRWTIRSGSPEIRGERLWLDGTSSDQVIESAQDFSGDFDVQVDFEVDTGAATNGWGLFLYAVCGNGKIGVRFGYPGSFSNSDAFRFVFYDGTWHDIASFGYSPSGSLRKGSFRLVRSGNVFTGYFLTNRWWTLGKVTLAEDPWAGRVTAETGLTRWESNPQVKGYLDNFHILYGELTPPKTFNLLSVTNKNGVVTRYSDYDLNGNAREVTEAAGTAEERITTYTYHPDRKGKPLTVARQSVLNPQGQKVTTYDYDSDGNDIPNENPTKRLSRVIEEGYSRDASGSVSQFLHETGYTYNAYGQLASMDGPRPGSGDVVIYSYYENGDLRSITRPLAGTVTFEQYDALGRVYRMVDENGRATTYTYDARGRVASITTEAGTTTITRSDLGAQGRREVITSPNGTSLRYSYDLTGKLIEIADSLNNRMVYGYDSEGNRTSELTYDPGGELARSIQYQYDQMNRLWKVLYPDGSDYEEYSYDPVGNRTSYRSGAGRLTSYLYDSLNRLKEVTQPGTVTTSYSYNGADNLVSVTDAEQHLMAYTYDDAGRLLETVSPDTGVTRYAYDEAGNLASKTDANGATVTYAYDLLNRLTLIDYPSDPDVSYTYDTGANGKGRLTGMHDGSGAYAYVYDAVGNLIREEKTIQGVTYTTDYTYDAAGILTGITYPDGRLVSYELDGAGRVARVTTTKDGVTKTLAQSVSYAPFGPLKGLSYGNGIVLTQSYDQRYRLTGIQAGAVLDLAYSRDGVGNITGITNNLDASRSQSFGYDALDRLESATGIYGSIGYSYDRVGNRLTGTLNGQVETYSYLSGTNRLVEVAGASAMSFSYDANGAITGMGANGFVYGQNSRLIQATASGSPVGEYTYNGSGQRVVKRASGKTTIFHYDKDGNLIAESGTDGTFLSSFVYLGAMRLARIESPQQAGLTVQVETSKGKRPSGLNVYGFTEGGSYTGKHAATETDGMARFQPEDFAPGSYKFRVDYLGLKFWSEIVSLPGTSTTGVLIPEETAEVAVTTASGPAEGVRVYLFSEDGSYLGVYGDTDAEGKVSFDLPVGGTFQFRADLMGSQYWSASTTISGGGTNNVSVAAGGGLFQVTVAKGPGSPMQGIKAYLFSSSGSYLGLSGVTDASGVVSFDVSQGTYKVRADYLGYQFWSAETQVAADTAIDLTIAHQQVGIGVAGLFQGTTTPLPGIKVYLFSPGGSYLGSYETTDSQGMVSFDLPERTYKVRADYLGGQFWSDEFTWLDTQVAIPMADAEVMVSGIGSPLAGVEVYAFTAAGSYLGVHGTTASDGRFAFRLPAGLYSFRADYQGNQYWSDEEILQADETRAITIPAGGGSFVLKVMKGTAEPLAGVKCYVFGESGSYIGLSGTTNSDGEVSFDLASGTYRFRVDHLGYQFWSGLIDVPDLLGVTVMIPHQDVAITVEGVFEGDRLARANVPVYLFSPSGSYLGLSAYTDGNGEVSFSLPEKPYKVRADYLGGQFWSDEFTWEEAVLTIPEGIAQVTLSMGSQVLSGTPVYVFSSGGSYLGLSATTDASGIVEFRLPAGSYRFRADYQGSQYWASAGIVSDTVNYVEVNAGGGEFLLTVDTGSGPLAGVKVYVFSAGGSYLGISATTDASGQVSFALSQGSYKFRVDYLGYQFWSPVYDVPQTLSDIFTIPHQEIAITVDGFYLTHEPIQGVKVYLFTASGSYVGISGVTDASGQVRFTLPERQYKVRVDYLGNQFWSDVFQSQDITVTINEGLARVHVHRTGVDQQGLKVYLFSSGGSYLSRSQTTDAYGEVEFVLPDRSFKFRVDQAGKQYWSGVVTIIAGEENPVELDLDQLALIETNNPNPRVFHGTPPAVGEGVRLAGLELVQGLLTQMVVGQVSQQAIFYYHNDHLGTPQKITDEAGAVVCSADYQPFGEVSVTAETVKNNFRFPGQYYDSETGLHYNWNRYYDPKLGRYLTPDPIGQVGETNLYPYVVNDPINSIDPFGLFELVLPRPISIGTQIPPGSLIDPIIMPREAIDDEITDVQDTAEEKSECRKRDPCRRLRERLEQHQRKLKEYRDNPYEYDNQGFLRGNPAERRSQIIQGRIRKLENQIRTFERDYYECLRKHGIPYT